jgi:outer membrane biosynthesis protein TonB
VVLGPRFLVEAGFIVAVAVAAGVEQVGTWSIVGLVAGAWILVALVELGLWARRAQQRAQPQPERLQPAPTREPIVVRPEPVRAPEPPTIAAVPPEPEPEREPEPEPEPEPEVAFLATNEAPREWNLWELERVSRQDVTADVAKTEERAYLLVYLREFAEADGNLPADFDGLVRDAFGDLLRAVPT